MKKKILSLLLTGTVAFSLVACGGKKEATEPADTQTEAVETQADTEQMQTDSIGNPWRESTEEEAYQYGPNGFSAPEGATNIRWSICEAKKDTDLPGTMIQLNFDYDGLSYTAREQPVPGTEITDISGMYYEWTVTDEGTLNNWGGGKMPCRFCRYIGDEGYVDVALWFDIETGYAYSLSTQSDDLDGYDIQAMVEMIYDPAKQIGANAPDLSELDEYSIEFIKDTAMKEIPAPNISGCDTFTQIVDKALTDGMGYANEQICGIDVLLVSTGTYDNLDGNQAAIDSVVYEYKDGVPYEIGRVMSAGTAYPLTINNGYLYTGSNHWICKYAIADDKLMIMEHIAIVYDTEGNGSYYYDSEDGGDYRAMDPAESERIYNKLVDEMMTGKIINYDTVKK